VPRPGINFWSIEIGQAKGDFEKWSGELFGITIDKFVTCELVEKSLRLVSVAVEHGGWYSRERPVVVAIGFVSVVGGRDSGSDVFAHGSRIGCGFWWREGNVLSLGEL